MKDVVKESLQKKHRNKSQEPAGKGEQDKSPSDAGDMSSGSSLEVLADDEDDEYRLREVKEVEGELNLAMGSATVTIKKEDDSKLLYGGDNQKLIKAQIQQLESIQQVKLARVGQEPPTAQMVEESAEADSVIKKKQVKFDYMLEPA